MLARYLLSDDGKYLSIFLRSFLFEVSRITPTFDINKHPTHAEIKTRESLNCRKTTFCKPFYEIFGNFSIKKDIKKAFKGWVCEWCYSAVAMKFYYLFLRTFYGLAEFINSSTLFTSPFRKKILWSLEDFLDFWWLSWELGGKKAFKSCSKSSLCCCSAFAGFCDRFVKPLLNCLQSVLNRS